VESDLQTSVVMLPPRQDCIEIFPRGGIIYITDEVFEQKPVEAFRLVAAFVRQVDICRTVTGPVDPWKRVNDGCLLWRLAVRPELMQTTYNWCIRHEAEVEAKDPAAQRQVSYRTQVFIHAHS
jgi:chromo domain-containing protein 1